jgi:hypothetical protein
MKNRLIAVMFGIGLAIAAPSTVIAQDPQDPAPAPGQATAAAPAQPAQSQATPAAPAQPAQGQATPAAPMQPAQGQAGPVQPAPQKKARPKARPKPAVSKKVLLHEVLRFALQTFGQQVAAYNTLLQNVDNADQQYRTDYGQAQRAGQLIAAMLNGQRSSDMTYPELLKSRADSDAAARTDLQALRTAAANASSGYAFIYQSPLLAYAYKPSSYSGARVDLQQFSKELGWGNSVQPDLVYFGKTAAATVTYEAGTDTGSTAGLSEQATTVATQVMEPSLQSFDQMVSQYDEQVQAASSADAAIKSGQKKAQDLGRKRPRTINRPTTTRRYVRDRNGRGHWVTQRMNNTNNSALNNWENSVRAAQDAVKQAESARNAATRAASDLYAVIQDYPALVDHEGYKKTDNKANPSLPLFQR